MSSLAVRNLIKDFLYDESDETTIDLTGHFEDIRELLHEEEVQPDAPWLGLEFIAEGDEPISLTANNEQGLYREVGLVQLHICAVGRLGVGNELVERGDVLQKLFKGRRIGALVVESVRPINTGPGATLEFEAGYVSGTVTVAYHYDSSPQND